MKKLMFFIFLLIAMVAIAQEYPTSGFQLRLDRFLVPPTNVSGYSHYDYMHGAYDGFPIRIQPDNVHGSGIYMTYMNQATPAQPRRQRMAFATMAGQVLDEREFLQGTHQEGFGTLAIDNDTGNPFFAWHFNGPPRVVRMVYDVYNYNYTPGQAISELLVVHENNPRPNRPTHPSSNTTVQEEEFNFVWPVIFIGPSPTEDYKRVYVFMSNIGLGWAPASTSSGYIQSSARILAFTDVKFDWDDESDTWYSYIFHKDIEDNIIWTIVSPEFFERIHYWHGNGETSTFARTFSSYAISQDGKVAFAGQMYTTRAIDEFVWERFDIAGLTSDHLNGPDLLPDYTGEWPGAPGEPYDHFVLWNDNYGEGEYNLKRINYERRWDPGLLIDFWGSDGELYPFNYQRNGPSISYDYCHYRMTTNTVNNAVISFDSNGKLLIPTAYGILFVAAETNGTIPGNPDQWRYYKGCENNYVIVYNPVDNTTRLDRLYPFPAYNVGQVVLPFDYNDDGVIDPEVSIYNSTGQLSRFFAGSLPYYHFDDANRFHTSQLRISNSNDGLMVMMWIDSYKSHRINSDTNPDPNYEAWRNTGELFISLSNNNGESWSAPLEISSVTHNQFQNIIPAFIYPADKPLRHSWGGNRATLYFMFTDDVDYGLNATGDPIYGGPGSYVKLAAVDVSWGVTETDVTTPKPEFKMLSQNYPNPFNPSTTINFDIFKAGKVNLSVYNLKGQLVKTLTDGFLNAGSHSITWHGVDNNNNQVASGVYFYKIETAGKQEIRRMALIK